MRFSDTAKIMKNIITRTPTKMSSHMAGMKFDSRTFDSRGHEAFSQNCGVSARYSA
jgi:hypothetical protein